MTFSPPWTPGEDETLSEGARIAGETAPSDFQVEEWVRMMGLGRTYAGIRSRAQTRGIPLPTYVNRALRRAEAGGFAAPPALPPVPAPASAPGPPVAYGGPYPDPHTYLADAAEALCNDLRIPEAARLRLAITLVTVAEELKLLRSSVP